MSVVTSGGITPNRQTINSDGMGLVFATTRTGEHFHNHQKQNAYTAIVEATTASTDDCFCYIKNTDDTYDLVISGAAIYAGTATTIKAYHILSGTPGGSLTTVTPSNSTVGSQNEADCIIYSSADITGLTHDGQLTHFRVPANNVSNQFQVTHGIVVPKNKMIGLYSTVASAIEMTLMFTFHNCE